MYASDLKHPQPSLQDKLQRLYTLKPGRPVDMGFRPPYQKLLRAFGNPHQKLPPVIHVAGTNGKGSAIAFLRAMLEQAGYSVHVFTSPHLIRFNERIVLAGKPIDDHALEELIAEAVDLNENQPVTFFEITTAMAFAAFSRTPADVVLLETGMGGRLDCTNVIENPAATVITAVDYDHMEFLGETLEDIACEKAGIMKPGSPCLVGAQKHDRVYEVLENRATELDAPFLQYGAQWRIAPDQDRFTLRYGGKRFQLPGPILQGQHQIFNAGAACATLQVLCDRFTVNEDQMARGIENAAWPARLENISRCFDGLIPEGWEIWLDGGHNQGAAEALAVQAATWQKQDGKPLHLVLGMMRRKDPLAFIKPLAPYLDHLHIVEIPDEPAGYTCGELAHMLETFNPEMHHSLKTAIIDEIAGKETAGRILIAGSLYLAGHILADLPQ